MVVRTVIRVSVLKCRLYTFGKTPPDSGRIVPNSVDIQEVSVRFFGSAAIVLNKV